MIKKDCRKCAACIKNAAPAPPPDPTKPKSKKASKARKCDERICLIIKYKLDPDGAIDEVRRRKAGAKQQQYLRLYNEQP